MKMVLVSVLILLVGCSSAPKANDLQQRYKDQLTTLSIDPSLVEFMMDFCGATLDRVESDLRTKEQLKEDIERIEKSNEQVLLGSVNQLRNLGSCYRVYNLFNGSAGVTIMLYLNEYGETILVTRSVTFF